MPFRAVNCDDVLSTRLGDWKALEQSVWPLLTHARNRFILSRKVDVSMSPKNESQNSASNYISKGGELHQTAFADSVRLTTNDGVVISDDQNSLKVGARGPVLLEDFVMREKITHFDHERIPERVVHARGYAAHGYFQTYENHQAFTKAAFLCNPSEKTPVFVRFSTVAGSAGSSDTVRDVRGFSVKFYTSQGNYDLVGNNIPVFFIQDAIKFPDIIHAVKPEPDRDFPQAQSAHDTFWDFVSLTPESTHMLLWVMSDRAIPRSFRMMQGFGVHTFRFVNSEGKSNFVKFHLTPKLGVKSLVWEEAQKIAGVDPDFHRRDLWSSIESGQFPEYELGVQIFDQEQADSFEFDILDATKLIPEELVPITPFGKMVLDRNVDNFFAETEQVAFCPSHLVPGIEFSDDPLLHGRIFSYLDTQLSRLGSPNFHQIPINQPKCPWANLQRDGMMQMQIPQGRVSYEPSSLDDSGPRECPVTGFKTLPVEVAGQKVRERPDSFSDHYTQARTFWRSMSEHEQRHIVAAFAFELGKCLVPKIRTRMLGHLFIVDDELHDRVCAKLGMVDEGDAISPVQQPKDLDASPALSQTSKTTASVAGQKIGVLVSNGTSAELIDQLKAAAGKEQFVVELVGLKAGPVKLDDGVQVPPDHFLEGAPSVLFDGVIIAVADPIAPDLIGQAAYVNWIRDAYSHLKVIGATSDLDSIIEIAGIVKDKGILEVDPETINSYLNAFASYKIWDRETRVRPE